VKTTYKIKYKIIICRGIFFLVLQFVEHIIICVEVATLD